MYVTNVPPWKIFNGKFLSFFPFAFFLNYTNYGKIDPNSPLGALDCQLLNLHDVFSNIIAPKVLFENKELRENFESFHRE